MVSRAATSKAVSFFVMNKIKLANIEGNSDYFCDEEGYIYSMKRGIFRKIKPSSDGGGYLGFSMCLKGVKKRVLAHRIIASTFIPNPYNKKQVNHINGVKNDNRVENLEWCTPSENKTHSYKKLGEVNAFKGLLGDKSPYSKKVLQKDLEGNILKTWGSLNETQRNGFNMSCIHKVINGKRKTHKGFKWEYLTNIK